MKIRKQLIAEVDPKLARKLKVRLAAEGCTYREWLEAQIVEYLQPQPDGGDEDAPVT